LFPFTHRCYKPNLVDIGSAVPEKKLKMFKSLRTTDDDGRKWIAIGHLSDSGDLEILLSLFLFTKQKMIPLQ
jgi:DNA helicase HerA-like ATPase